jgi:hypothetical protein
MERVVGLIESAEDDFGWCGDDDAPSYGGFEYSCVRKEERHELFRLVK